MLTDFPERFSDTVRLYLGEARAPLTLQGARLVSRAVLLKFAGVDTRAQAQTLVGETLWVRDSEAIQLPPNTYFWHQIIGLRVRTVEGLSLGTVVEVLPTGSNDVYVVRGGKQEVLVPAIEEVVRDIDLDAGVMTIAPLEGLL